MKRMFTEQEVRAAISNSKHTYCGGTAHGITHIRLNDLLINLGLEGDDDE